jgi:hypothetical protein
MHHALISLRESLEPIVHSHTASDS